MTDEQLREETTLLKQRLKDGETVDDILPEAFATVREASGRILGMRPFDVQVLGAVTLHNGMIAEMKTGEGKTLVATMPAYLNALTSQGVHVVTVNEYLAQHAVDTLKPLYEFLGLTVEVLKESMSVKQRQHAYNADITYTTNTELGFDYLRDHMATDPANLTQRGHHFTIVDEVDSILIDEARTPLIISDADSAGKELHQKFAKIVATLENETDYVVKLKDKKVYPTEEGIAKVEKALDVENLYDASNLELVSFFDAHLRAKEIYIRDRDYIVDEDSILLVDEHTGRIMDGRRISHGIHQAIEAKEGVSVQDENATAASVTLQNYFKLYQKLSGMSGTAAVASGEFDKTYKLAVVVIPPNLPNARVDNPDRIYATLEEKYEAVTKLVQEKHKTGQPVLVGTASVASSEIVSAALKKANIPHMVLNAKAHAAEAKVIAMAGHKGAVTVSTNMAGRGTDITLGGNPEFLATEYMNTIADEFEDDPVGYSAKHKQVLDDLVKKHAAEAEEVRKLGGLCVIGTERHDSRRIDIQLRGRSGRQGDPGESHFFLSLQDPMLARFPNSFLTLLSASSSAGNLASNRVVKILDNAQSQLEDMHATSRKNMVKYDDVTSTQRRNVYEQRTRILQGELDIVNIRDLGRVIVEEQFDKNRSTEEQRHLLAAEVGLTVSNETLNKQTAVEAFNARVEEIEQTIKDTFVENADTVIKTTVRTCFLTALDRRWRQHIKALDALQNGVGLRGYAQKDPVVEFQEEAHVLYMSLLRAAQNDAVSMFLRVKFQQ